MEKSEQLSILESALDNHKRALEAFFRDSITKVIEAAERIAVAIRSGNKVMICGNGGSAADAQHMAAEFVNRFLVDRDPFSAIALTTDTSILTSIGNDYSFDEIFSKQVKALGRSGDVLITISTSGNSRNCIRAIEVAKELNIYTIGLLGGKGVMKDMVDLCLLVPDATTPRVQEIHILVIHMLCELVEKDL